MDNQHKMISGYRDLSQEEIDIINEIKQKEEEAAQLLNKLSETVKSSDRRSLAIARTHLQIGFMFLVRAIAQPKSNW